MPTYSNDRCFLCNQEIDLGGSFELAVSFPSVLPRGANRPSNLLWVHDECAAAAADPAYEFPDSLPEGGLRFKQFIDE